MSLLIYSGGQVPTIEAAGAPHPVYAPQAQSQPVFVQPQAGASFAPPAPSSGTPQQVLAGSATPQPQEQGLVGSTTPTPTPAPVPPPTPPPLHGGLTNVDIPVPPMPSGGGGVPSLQAVTQELANEGHPVQQVGQMDAWARARAALPTRGGPGLGAGALALGLPADWRSGDPDPWTSGASAQAFENAGGTYSGWIAQGAQGSNYTPQQLQNLRDQGATLSGGAPIRRPGWGG